MRKVLFASAIALSFATLAAPAGAQIYRCENGNGVVEYGNAPVGKNTNCKAVELPTITTIPATKAPVKSAAASPSPSSFPKVDSPTQKARDNDRRQILEDELQREQSRLSDLKKEFNGGEPERLGSERNYQKYLDRVQRLKEDIGRSEGNVASLQRELSSVKN